MVLLIRIRFVTSQNINWDIDKPVVIVRFHLYSSGKCSNDTFSSAMVTSIHITGNAFLLILYTSGLRHPLEYVSHPLNLVDAAQSTGENIKKAYVFNILCYFV